MALRSYSYYEGLLSDPRVQAALNTVSWADGLMGHPLAADDPYSTTYGYDTFDNSGWHPGKDGRGSSAVGKYQAMAYSFPDIAVQLGIPNIDAVNQDVFAVALIDRAGALDDVLSGNVEKFAEKLNGVWTSLPGGPQPRVTETQVKEAYKDYYSAAKNNPSTLGYTNPQQPTKTKDSPTLAAQKGLAGLGYVPAEDMTGGYGRVGAKGRHTYDKSLVEGIKAFQRDYGLPQTGELNARTLDAIAQQADAQAALDSRLGMLPDIMSAPGGIIDTGRTIVDGMDYTRASADLQPGFDQYEAGRNLSRTMPEIMSVPGGLLDGRLEMAAGSMPANWQSAFDTGRFGQPAPFDGRLERAAGSLPAYTPQFESAKAFDAGRFATYQPPAPNSPEKAYENAVRNSYFENLAANPAPAPTGQNLGISAAIGGAGRPNPPAAQTRSAAFNPTDNMATDLMFAASKPAAPTIAAGTPQAQSLANAYAAYGNTRAMAPAAPKAPTATAIDVPNSAMSLAQQYASYGMGKMPLETAVTATQAVPSPAPARTVAPPALEAPRTVAPRQVTPYTPPEQPAMTPEKAKALGMVPSGVPGKYMPAVPGNPAQVMRDQMGLIARNPIASIGNMIMGALQGGVFYDRLIPDFMTAPGGLFGNLQAQAAAPASRQSIGYGLTAPGGGGLGGLGGGINGGAGAFQAGGGNWGNYGSSGTFNSGFQTGSGFTYDR